jgi:hypothetical protein
MSSCSSCGAPCPICSTLSNYSTEFPSVEQRLAEAEQCLLEAGCMLADADTRTELAEARATRAEALVALSTSASPGKTDGHTP